MTAGVHHAFYLGLEVNICQLFYRQRVHVCSKGYDPSRPWALQNRHDPCSSYSCLDSETESLEPISDQFCSRLFLVGKLRILVNLPPSLDDLGLDFASVFEKVRQLYHSSLCGIICILNEADAYISLSEKVKLLGSYEIPDSTPAPRCLVSSDDRDRYSVRLLHNKLCCPSQLVCDGYLCDLQGTSVHVLGSSIVVDWFHTGYSYGEVNLAHPPGSAESIGDDYWHVSPCGVMDSFSNSVRGCV